MWWQHILMSNSCPSRCPSCAQLLLPSGKMWSWCSGQFFWTGRLGSCRGSHTWKTSSETRGFSRLFLGYFQKLNRNFHIFSITYLTGGSFRVWRVELKKRNHARWGPRKLSIWIIFLCFRDPSTSLSLHHPLCCGKFPKIFPQNPRPRPDYSELKIISPQSGFYGNLQHRLHVVKPFFEFEEFKSNRLGFKGKRTNPKLKRVPVGTFRTDPGASFSGGLR